VIKPTNILQISTDMYTFTGDIQKETVNIKKLLVKQLLQFSQYVSWCLALSRGPKYHCIKGDAFW